MKPFSGALRIQNIYEACIPYRLRYPYKIVKKTNTIELKNELFVEKDRDRFVDEGEEIEIGTNYKLRPVIILSQLRQRNTYLALALTKRKDSNPKYLLEVCNNRIKSRHFLPKNRYSGILRYDSYVMVDAIHLVTKENIYYPRGRLDEKDYEGIRAKLKRIIS